MDQSLNVYRPGKQSTSTAMCLLGGREGFEGFVGSTSSSDLANGP